MYIAEKNWSYIIYCYVNFYDKTRREMETHEH